MTELVLTVPDKNTPGFLRRSKRALEFQQAMSGDITPDKFDAMVEFLLDFAQEPADRDEARRMLWDDLSEQQYYDILAQITGSGENSTIPPESETPS
jgi:hypothetical protein